MQLETKTFNDHTLDTSCMEAAQASFQSSHSEEGTHKASVPRRFMGSYHCTLILSKMFHFTKQDFLQSINIFLTKKGSEKVHTLELQHPVSPFPCLWGLSLITSFQHSIFLRKIKSSWKVFRRTKRWGKVPALRMNNSYYSVSFHQQNFMKTTWFRNGETVHNYQH